MRPPRAGSWRRALSATALFGLDRRARRSRRRRRRSGRRPRPRRRAGRPPRGRSPAAPVIVIIRRRHPAAAGRRTGGADHQRLPPRRSSRAGSAPSPAPPPAPRDHHAGQLMTVELDDARPRSTAHELRFRAMGSEVHVIVVGGPARTGAPLPAPRIDELEARWSRFRPDSEISRLNRSGRSAGARLARHARRRRRRGATRGAPPAAASTRPCSPRSSRPATTATSPRVDARLVAPGPRAPAPAPGCAGIVIDPLVRRDHASRRLAIDLGGIGKGLAADLVVAELSTRGRCAACASTSAATCASAVRRPTDRGLGRRRRAPARRARSRWPTARSRPARRPSAAGPVDGATLHHLVDPRRGRARRRRARAR